MYNGTKWTLRVHLIKKKSIITRKAVPAETAWARWKHSQSILCTVVNVPNKFPRNGCRLALRDKFYYNINIKYNINAGG